MLILLVYIGFLFQAIPTITDRGTTLENPQDSKKIEWSETEIVGVFEYLGEWQFLDDSVSTQPIEVLAKEGWKSSATAIFPNDTSSSWPVYGWFRANLPKGVLKSGKKLNTATIYIRGAADIYLNGVLWKQFGKPSKNAENEILARNFEFYPIALDTSKANNILVRFSNHKREALSKVGIYSGFRLLFGDYDSFVANRANNGASTSNVVAFSLIGFAAAFLILHLLIYIFNRQDKYNLAYVLLLVTYISSYSLNIAIQNQANVDLLYWMYVFEAIMVLAMHMALLFFVYEVAFKDIPLVGYILLGLGSLGIMKILWFGGSLKWENSQYFPLSYNDAIYMITYIEIARSMLTASSKHKNAKIIAVGGSITLAFGVLNLFAANFLANTGFLTTGYPGMIALFISMSVYLATNLTDTNKSLAQKLIEVKNLSKQNLNQERERSNLLLQNEKVRARAQIAELQTKAMEEENRRKSFELEEARKLQLSMLPQQLPQINGFEICAKVFTASEVGGDYYDYHQKNDRNELLLTLGDATGHGVAAGTMVTATKALFQNSSSSASLDVVLRELSAALQSMNFKRMFMSLSLLRLHQDHFEYCAAGMPGLWLLNAEDHSIIKLISKGMALGTKVQFNYQVLTQTLKKGDSLILLSDGFTELFNEENKMMDEKWLKAKLIENQDWSASKLAQCLEKIMKDWQGNAPLKDDASYLVVHKSK